MTEKNSKAAMAQIQKVTRSFIKTKGRGGNVGKSVQIYKRLN